jgi:hypothetical protein
MSISARFEADYSMFVAETQKATASLSKMESTSQSVGTAIGDLKTGAERLAGAFGIAFSVEALIGFATNVAEQARSLQILSAQTQINVEDLQVLGAATKEFGVDSEQLGRAIFQLGQRIAGGDASVVSGLALMGLSLDDVKNKHGEELFLLVEDAAGKLHGTIRDTAMADLYGARLGSSLGALSTGIGEAIDKAKALNVVTSEDSVKAAAEYANAIDRASTSLKAMATEVEGHSAQMFNVVNDALTKGAGKWATFWAVTKDVANQLTLTGTGSEHLTRLLDDLSQKTDANAKATAGALDQHKAMSVALSDEEQHQQFLATLQANAAVALTAAQIADLEQLKAIGELNAKNAAGIGVNAAQFAKYTAGVEAAKKAIEDLAKASAEADAIVMTGYANRIKGLEAVTAASLKSYGFGAQIAALGQLDAAERALAKTVFDSLTSTKDRAKVIEETTTRHIALMNEEAAVQLKQAALVNAAVVAEFDAQVKLNAEWGLNASGAIAVQLSALDTYTRALDALHQTKVEGILQSKQEQVLLDVYTKSLYDDAVAEDRRQSATLAANTVLADTMRISDATSDRVVSGTVRMTQAMSDALVAASKLSVAIDQFGRTTVTNPSGGTGTVGAGGTITWTPPTTGIFATGPARAGGGLVSAGTSYPVGEHGPELFTPGANGFITPNGGMTVHNHNTFNIVDTESNIARRVSEHLKRTILQGRKIGTD